MHQDPRSLLRNGNHLFSYLGKSVYLDVRCSCRSYTKTLGWFHFSSIKVQGDHKQIARNRAAYKTLTGRYKFHLSKWIVTLQNSSLFAASLENNLEDWRHEEGIKYWIVFTYTKS